jgi:cytochrome c
MPPLNREVQLRCPIALFEQVEPKIRSLTTLIDSTHDLQNRAEFAQSLLAQCEKLLHCESFDETNMNCRLCHHISGLRQKTAELVLKVAQSPRFEEREA